LDTDLRGWELGRLERRAARRTLRASCTACLLAVGAGCATLRTLDEPEPNFFSGTRDDWDTVSHPMRMCNGPLGALFGLVDLPLSLVCDILVLPVHAVRSSQEDQKKNQNSAHG